jgi:hypothetical protein
MSNGLVLVNFIGDIKFIEEYFNIESKILIE